jgi:hypothetical protein
MDAFDAYDQIATGDLDFGHKLLHFRLGQDIGGELVREVRTDQPLHFSDSALSLAYVLDPTKASPARGKGQIKKT